MPSLDPATIVILTLIGSLILFFTEALRYEVTALLVVVILAGSGVLTSTEAFSGFSSPAVILIASMYVFGRAVVRWGIAEVAGEKLLKTGSHSEASLCFSVTFVAAILSTVLSNTGVCAAMIPVVSTVARKRGVPASRLLMPLAFGSLLGGTVTVIGTSSNIALNGMLLERGLEGFTLFEFARVGIILVVLGSLYFLGPGRLLLPRRRVDESLSEHYQIPKFVTEILVEPSSNLINRSVIDLPHFERYGITVLSIVRSDTDATVIAPGPYNRVRPDDVLIVQGEPDALLRMREDLGMRERESVSVGDTRLDSADVQLVEAVIPVNSPLAGQTLVESDFTGSTGLNVLAISKKGDVHPKKIGHSRLNTGDTLLIQGHRRDVDRARQRREVLVLTELEPPPIGRGAMITLALLGFVLFVAAFDIVPLEVAALFGALGLVLTRCVTAEDALRSVDWPIVILIGGMLALGAGFTKSGLGDSVAMVFGDMHEANPRWILLGLLVATASLTQLTNNVASVSIMTPIALAVAEQADLQTRPLLVGVLLGASMAFMSPVGHQSNAMVAGPGDYRFKDYLRVGTPLTIFMCLAAWILIPLMWDLR